MGVIKAFLARHFTPQKSRPRIRLVGCAQLDFGHDQAVVVTEELIDLEDMITAGHKPTELLYDPRLAQAE